jgi:protein ImuB
MLALVEHLRARLGEAAVYGIRCVSEHRPENAWSVAEPALTRPRPHAAADAAGTAGPQAFARPLWLLHVPEELTLQQGGPCHGGRLERFAGPERIETGWWDSAGIRRDYYIARNPRGAQLWIYRQFGGPPVDASRWFLHGIFG